MSYNKETGLWEGFIYKIYNDVNDKVYIGQTIRTIEERWRQHKAASNDKEKYYYSIYNAIRKYGKNKFHIKEIEKICFNDKSSLCKELNEREIYWISYYNSYNNGYNQTTGGDNAPNKFTERSVDEYTLEGVKLNTYDSLIQAADATGFSRGDINSCCLKTKINRVGNRIFRYTEEQLTNEEIEWYKINYPKIYQYDFNGILLNTFDFIQDVVDYMQKIGINCDSTNISACCKGKYLSAYGFIWRKYPDDFITYKLPQSLKRIEQRDKINGNLICVYNSFSEIADKFGKTKISTINNCCNNHTHVACGYHWCYENEFDYSNLNNQHLKAINQFDIDGNFIKSFESITDAVKLLNLKSKSAVSTIGAVCNGKSKSAYGYVWRFVNDDYDKYNVDFKNNANCKKVFCYSKDGCLLKIYNSPKEASLDLNLCVTYIHKHCRGNTSAVRSKYILSYTELNNEDIKKRLTNKKRKSVNKYNKDNIFINTYTNINDLANELNVTTSSIISCCKGRCKTIKGYKLFYATDPNQPDKSKIIV